MSAPAPAPATSNGTAADTPHGLSLGPVSYIVGVTLLFVVATCLLAAACLLRRKDRLHRARLDEEQRQHALRTGAAAEAGRATGQACVIPVVIVQPDGAMQLAEECGKLEPALAEAGSTKGGDHKLSARQSPAQT
ncbi:hypothetical protein ACK3TF_000065 [Chlorella vulgaris]